MIGIEALKDLVFGPKKETKNDSDIKLEERANLDKCKTLLERGDFAGVVDSIGVINDYQFFRSEAMQLLKKADYNLKFRMKILDAYQNGEFSFAFILPNDGECFNVAYRNKSGIKIKQYEFR